MSSEFEIVSYFIAVNHSRNLICIHELAMGVLILRAGTFLPEHLRGQLSVVGSIAEIVPAVFQGTDKSSSLYPVPFRYHLRAEATSYNARPSDKRHPMAIQTAKSRSSRAARDTTLMAKRQVCGVVYCQRKVPTTWYSSRTLTIVLCYPG